MKNTGAIFDLDKVVYTDETFSENEIQSVTESFEKEFETTLRFVPRGKTIITISCETKRIPQPKYFKNISI
ncbi:hypothetical protein ACMDB5_13105 [Flavobacterium sp. W1B]|uniref:hypothetical protein n=1 Tax=Flavobacterium sp. W1B TaxID=3394146 RepID=UPI0039BCE114